MFVGSINADLRSTLARLAPAWRGLPAYVGCSGNFTVERILAAQGLSDLHGNDVSLYSCALGAYLSGRPFRVEVQDGDLAWLSDWLQPGLPTLATLLLCTSALDFHGRDHPYHRRMWNAYLRRWPDLHAKTLANLEKGLAGLPLRGFYAGDVVDFLDNAPQDSLVISFPPTYKGGYERLYEKLQAAFAWDEPTYELFTTERFQSLLERMTAKRFWCVSRDEPVQALAEHQIGRVQTSLRSKPVHVYANVPAAVLTQARQRVEDVPHPRLSSPHVAGRRRTVRGTLEDGQRAVAHTLLIDRAKPRHGAQQAQVAPEVEERYGQNLPGADLQKDAEHIVPAQGRGRRTGEVRAGRGGGRGDLSRVVDRLHLCPAWPARFCRDPAPSRAGAASVNAVPGPGQPFLPGPAVTLGGMASSASHCTAETRRGPGFNPAILSSPSTRERIPDIPTRGSDDGFMTADIPTLAKQRTFLL
jgi:hypothetical protein